MASPVILCSTPRLARSLRLAHGRQQQAAGLARWQPLTALTLAQWLDTVISDALICGEVDAAQAPAPIPGRMQERILWERVIADALRAEAAAALFDLGGLAAMAMEANQLMQVWRIALPGEQQAETQQFLRWRAAFRQACAQYGWLEPARYVEWQIDQLQAGVGRLPAQVDLAGFDRVSPQETRLIDVLRARGIRVGLWPMPLAQPADAVQVALADQDAECRAAVAWAARQLAINPQARLAIVAPELGSLRSKLAALLDDVLHPAAVTPAAAELPRRYDFSLGVPLASYPLVAAAMQWLRLLGGRHRIEQDQLGQLLLQPYVMAGQFEADGRAQLDAALRRDLPPYTSLHRLVRYARRQAERGTAVTQLADCLDRAMQLLSAQPARQPFSAWASVLRELLVTVGWPGERSLSSHEFQARATFLETLSQLGRLDRLLGPVSMAEAVRRLGQYCTEQIFQPRSERDPNILVMGMLEAAGEPLDAIWVMGMNNHLWPPPARPNPLLPATAQRAVRSPNADAAVQAEFAGVIHARLLHSAPQLVFSHAHAEGDRELRPSPLLAALPQGQAGLALAETLAETLAQAGGDALEFVSDHRAPGVQEGERVKGGAGLLKAQAVCPAWAYYQYRLGARELEAPEEGLDAAGRGSLLHMALERFWQGHGSAYLAGLSETGLASAVQDAVTQALEKFNAEREEPLPAGFLRLEGERLQRVMLVWLAFEKTREAGFEVQACEQEIELDIEGIAVRLVIDRVDRLDDDSLVILDYKTGASLDYKNWADDRITEPQLPIYASLALAGKQVVAVAFAKVRADDTRFSGIAAEDGLLPGVLGLSQDKVRKDFPEERFPDWAALLAHWQSSVAAIAQEVRAGEAAVRFADELALEYCEVKPLLRLPERKLLFERENG